ncbi:hypothetical protein GUITHDRAFT_110643 [Guillardia theta CCMP2712]|uniref:Receptor ligand binding region domain-containing protein n=1 Tax=Guillardia theta (strain CCMP2712) TaxID=905079 RepID=L1J3Y1_GUITC|nr:hypothetical protein GUITHDRAFT_110643 [Guillardia theta CCMP2712]EKX43226.1 hypothetical protein GUITHDRAFT_110643 [Guillardia theta CCMP2712]|eukprot:XP_005830206.1 hypothetical protein GUITHDRAFT_110643 [Guillardia theta CCMP2712]
MTSRLPPLLLVACILSSSSAAGQSLNSTVGVLSPVLVKTYGSVPLLAFKQVSMACLIALYHVNTRDPQIVGQAVVDRLPQGFRIDVKFKDSQFDAAEALKEVLAWRESSSIDAIVGPMTSDGSQVVSLVSALQGTPVTSFGASSTLLSDKQTYPLFSRTNPLIMLNAMALIEVCLRFKWKQIAVLCEDTTYGNGFLSNVQEQASSKGVDLVQVQKFVPEGSKSIAAAMSSLQKSRAKIFLYLGIGVPNLELVLTYSNKEGLLQDGHAWVAGEIGVPSAVVASMQHKQLAALLKGWIQIRVAPLYGKKRDLLETAFRTVDQSKVNNSIIGMKPAEYSMPLPDYASFAYDAAWATALGLAKTNGTGAALAHAIRNSSFPGASGLVSFDASGDREPNGIVVTIENIQPSSANASVIESVVIGTWEAAQAFADVSGLTPLWPGGRSGWNPPSDGSGQGRDKLLTIVLAVSGGFLVLLLAISAAFYRLYKASLRNRTAEETDLSNMMSRVREALGVTVSAGYILPSEKSSSIFSCYRRSRVIVMDKRSVEAVAKLALGDDFAKNDFERFYDFVKYRADVVAGRSFGMIADEESMKAETDALDLEAQQGGGGDDRDDAATAQPHPHGVSSDPEPLELEERRGRQRHAVETTHSLYEDEAFTQYLSGDFERAYEYFTGRVLRLNAWRDNPQLLPRLKKHIQRLMDKLARINDRRYESMMKEAGGAELKEVGQGFADALFYQDDHQVRAIRVEEEDRKESSLHKKLETWRRLSTGSLMLREDVFISQLHSRAVLLNDSFHSKLVDVLKAHAAECEVERPAGRAAGQGAKGVRIACHFDDGVHPIEFVPAAVKKKPRMAEKVMEYAAAEEEDAGWPYSRRVLDPVRASVICNRPSHMAQVYRWLTSQGKTGMRVCRVKNKLSLEEAPDGYRDIMVCLLFEGEDRLRSCEEVEVVVGN